MWTIEAIKNQLPPVKVLLNGRVFDGKITGRKNNFPMIYVFGTPIGWEFSWEAIQNSLNSGTPLRVD
jgi:hypothetical protein